MASAAALAAALCLLAGLPASRASARGGSAKAGISRAVSLAGPGGAGSGLLPGVLTPPPLYAPSSPFKATIPPNASISPESAAMVRSLEAGAAQKGFVLTIGEWTVPTYLAGPATPRQTVALGRAPSAWAEPASYRGFPPGWSDSLDAALPERMLGVPIPPQAEPDPSSDAHLTVLEPVSGCEYDLYGAERTAAGWQAVWANSTRITGSGVYPDGMAPTAAGFAGDAGLIWPAELASGHIDHALMFAYPFTKAGGPVLPATSSDGRSTQPGAIPEGTRVRLNPRLDLSKLSLAPYQRTIAEALQTYGMILGDTGGAMGLFAVGSQSFRGNPYPGLPSTAFPDLGAIPISQLEVLASSPQVPNPDLALHPSGCGSFS